MMFREKESMFSWRDPLKTYFMLFYVIQINYSIDYAASSDAASPSPGMNWTSSMSSSSLSSSKMGETDSFPPPLALLLNKMIA